MSNFTNDTAWNASAVAAFSIPTMQIKLDESNLYYLWYTGFNGTAYFTPALYIKENFGNA